MRLLHGTVKRLAEETGYSTDYIRKVRRGERRNARLELLIERELRKAEQAERIRRRLKRRREGR